MQIAGIDNMKVARDLAGLIAALEEADDHVREAAADALSGFADERAAEALEKAKFHDTSMKVRRAASLAHVRVAERLREKRGELP
jgi:HEAT repeat protein